MPDARQLTMIALAVSAAVASAVLVVGMAPSTEPESGDPLAANDPSSGQPAEVPLGPDGRPLATHEPGSDDVPSPSGPPVGGSASGSQRPAGQPGSPAASSQGSDDPGRPGSDAPRPRPSSGTTARTVPSGGSSTSRGGGSSGSAGGDQAPPDGFRDDASAQRADWMEERMTAFIDTLIPEAQGTGLSRSCAANGRTCTFEGPATDDFATRWVQALSYGDMEEGDLEGMTLRDFSFYETDDGLRFSITAKHPKDP